jgi:hypothetical protein
VVNSFGKMIVKNANTRAQGGEHLLVLAHLRRWWSLSGREGLGSSLPPAELARWDLGVFEELKRLFSTTPEFGIETEANGGHKGDRTLHRTRSRFDRTRPVSSTEQSGTRGFRVCNRRVRSLAGPAHPVRHPEAQSASLRATQACIYFYIYIMLV